MARIPFGSEEYLFVPVTVEGEVPSNPVVEMAVVPFGTAPSTAEDWHAADWVEGRVRYLLDGTLTPGRYAVWVRITDNPERATRLAGDLTIT